MNLLEHLKWHKLSDGDHVDVRASAPTDGQVLTWNAATKTWLAAAASDPRSTSMLPNTRITTGVGERLETRGPGDRGPGQVITGPSLVIGSVVLGTPKIPRSNFTIPKDHFYRLDGRLTTGPNIRMTTEANATLETANLNSGSRIFTPGRG